MTVTLLKVPQPVDTTVVSSAGHYSWDPKVIGLSNGGYMIAWEEYSPSDTGGDDDVNAKVYDALGNVTRSQFTLSSSSAGYQSNPSLAALSTGRVIAAWGSDGDIKGQFFTGSGAKTGSEFVIATGGNWQVTPSVTALQGGGFVVTWLTYFENDEVGTYADSVDAQIFSSTGAKVGGPIHVAAMSGNWKGEPAVQALSNGGFAIAWTEDNVTTFVEKAYLKVYSATGAKAGSQLTLGTVADEDSSVGLAAVGDKLVAIWSAQTGSESWNLKGQFISSAGAKLGSVFNANSTSTGQEENPSVVSSGDGFVVTWEHGNPDGPDGDESALRGQRFDAAGHRLGEEFGLGSGNDEFDPNIGKLRNGGLVTVWDDDTSGHIDANVTPAWTIEVDRYNLEGDDTGKTDIIFKYNGVEVYRTTQAHFDDASVVKAGTYEAIVRTNAHTTQPCIELINGYSGAYTTKVQTAVQIHGGISTQNSEGCVVMPADLLKSILTDYVEPSFWGIDVSQVTPDTIGADGKKIPGVQGYVPPVPVSVTIKDMGGPILQPKLSLGADISVSEGHSGIVAFDLVQAGPSGDAAISKVLCVTFKVSGNAQYNADWVFGDTIVTSYDRVTHVWSDKSLADCFKSTTGTLEFWVYKLEDVPDITLLANTDGLTDTGETVTFTLTDVDVYRIKTEFGIPIKYAESNEVGLGKIDKLFMPNDKAVTVTISDPAAAAQIPVSPHVMTADSPHWFQPVDLLAQDLLALA